MRTRAELVLDRNAEYSVQKLLPGFLGFGSNGAGELLAFDLRQGEPYPVVMVPFIGMDPDNTIQIEASFEELREVLGTRSRGR